MRIGIGYDVHPLAPGRRLVLGGVMVPHGKGLSGHSDGDVLTHAVIDALLGAAGQGDIGTLFPSTEAAYRGADSLKLLAQVTSLISSSGWRIENVDATIVAQQPKLSPFIKQMSACLSRAMGLAESQVNVKAKTTNGLGFAGREEGIAAYAVTLLEKSK